MAEKNKERVITEDQAYTIQTHQFIRLLQESGGQDDAQLIEALWLDVLAHRDNVVASKRRSGADAMALEELSAAVTDFYGEALADALAALGSRLTFAPATGTVS